MLKNDDHNKCKHNANKLFAQKAINQACRIPYFDYLRAFAIFAVIIIHISSQNQYIVDVSSRTWQVFNFYDSISRWAVPIFVMISGALFLNRNIPIKKIFSKYILRLGIAFIIWSILYLLLTPGNFSNRLVILIQGHYHMWFILMIIGLYICMPIFRVIVQNKTCTRYFLVLSLLFTFITPTIVALTVDFIENQKIVAAVLAINRNIEIMGVNTVLGYASYFILGYYLSNLTLSKKKRRVIYILGLISFISTILLTSALSLKTQQSSQHYYENLRINTLLESIAIFTFFKYSRFAQRESTIISIISKLSFGIYLSHALIINLLSFVFKLNTLSFNPVLSVPCISLIVLFISLLLSWILSKIPIVKKYLI